MRLLSLSTELRGEPLMGEREMSTFRMGGWVQQIHVSDSLTSGSEWF